MTVFEQIHTTVSRIPAGSVASYGEVAKATGLFRGARLVGWALKALPEHSSVPWQRVINQKGMLSIQNPKFPDYYQAELLRNEGVTIEEIAGNLFVINPPWFTFPTL